MHDDFKPQIVYNRHEWNCEYENICNSFSFTSKMHGDLKLFQQQKMPSKFSKAIQNQPENVKGARHRSDAVPVDEHLHQTPSNVTGKENTLTDQDSSSKNPGVTDGPWHIEGWDGSERFHC